MCVCGLGGGGGAVPGGCRQHRREPRHPRAAAPLHRCAPDVRVPRGARLAGAGSGGGRPRPRTQVHRAVPRPVGCAQAHPRPCVADLCPPPPSPLPHPPPSSRPRPVFTPPSSPRPSVHLACLLNAFSATAVAAAAAAEQAYQLHAAQGLVRLRKAVDDWGAGHPFTRLCPDLSGQVGAGSGSGRRAGGSAAPAHTPEPSRPAPHCLSSPHQIPFVPALLPFAVPTVWWQGRCGAVREMKMRVQRSSRPRILPDLLSPPHPLPLFRGRGPRRRLQLYSV